VSLYETYWQPGAVALLNGKPSETIDLIVGVPDQSVDPGMVNGVFDYVLQFVQTSIAASPEWHTAPILGATVGQGTRWLSYVSTGRAMLVVGFRVGNNLAMLRTLGASGEVTAEGTASLARIIAGRLAAPSPGSQ